MGSNICKEKFTLIEDDLEKGLEIAQEKNQPVMLVVFSEWCPTCKILLPQYAADPVIRDKCCNFVVVKCKSDYKFLRREYAPDGAYIPRVLFLNSKGRILKQFYNQNAEINQRYFYPTTQDLAATIDRVLLYFSKQNQ